MLNNQINVVESLVDPQSSTQCFFLNLGTLLVEGEGGEGGGYDTLSL